VRKRTKLLRTELGKTLSDRRTTAEKMQADRLKKKLPHKMSRKERFESGINEIDSLMYIPLDWGKRGAPTEKELRSNMRQRKPKVREHFNGLVKLPFMTENHIVEDISPRWVYYVFRPVFVELVKKRPFEWWPVVVGNARAINTELPPLGSRTLVKVEYQQGDKNQCLLKSAASALHYCGLPVAASALSNVAPTLQYLPRDTAIKSLRELIMTHAPEIGGVAVFNKHNNKRKTNRISIQEMIENQTPYFTMVIPRSNDGAASHAIAVVDDIIFDATQSHALKLNRGSLDWICGKLGIGEIDMALRFQAPFKTKQRYTRSMNKNW